MNAIVLGARLGLLALTLALILPVQMLALARDWGLSRHLPVWFHRAVLRLFSVRVIARGTPPDGQATLVLSNHVSWLDICVIGSLRPLSFVAKSEVATWPLVGLLARLQRSVFIDRQRRMATAGVNDMLARRLRAGETIVLFAEGTTGDGTRLLPFRSSLVGAAAAAGEERPGGPAPAPIELKPLALAYVRRNGLPVTRRERPEIAWYGDMDLAPHLGLFARNGPLDVVVTWCPPLALDGDRKRATARAESAVRAVLNALRPDGAVPYARQAEGIDGERGPDHKDAV